MLRLTWLQILLFPALQERASEKSSVGGLSGNDAKRERLRGDGRRVSVCIRVLLRDLRRPCLAGNVQLCASQHYMYMVLLR